MTQGFTRRALLSGLVLPPLGLLCGCAPDVPDGSDEGLRPSDRESECIDVRVVDRDLADYREDGLYRTCNQYSYDDQGFLTRVEEVAGPLSESEGAVSRIDLEYDESGRLASTATSYAHLDWGVAGIESFEYDDAGDCVLFTSEVVSQGSGKRECSYKRGDDGRIVSARVDDYVNPRDFTRYEVSFEYADSGVLLKVVASQPGPMGIFLSEEKSDMGNRVYAYTYPWDTTDFLRFDEAGSLTSVEAFGAGSGREIRKYDYKTITVRRDRFVPSIYSNPLGLPACFAPSLPQEMASKIIGG